MGWFTNKKKKKSNKETCETECIEKATKRLDDMDQKLLKMDKKLDSILEKETCRLKSTNNN